MATLGWKKEIDYEATGLKWYREIVMPLGYNLAMDNHNHTNPLRTISPSVHPVPTEKEASTTPPAPTGKWAATTPPEPAEEDAGTILALPTLKDAGTISANTH